MAQFDSYTLLTGANAQGTDEIGIWDGSATEFKNMTLTELTTFMEGSLNLSASDVGAIATSGDQTLSGQLTIATTNDSPLRIQQLGLSDTAGKDPGWNYISFLDTGGDRQGYFGITNTGDFQFTPEITGAQVVIASSWLNLTGGSIALADGFLIDGRDPSVDGTKLDTIDTNANNYTHPSDGGGNVAPLTGALVFDDITINTAGHVTGTSTRSLTPADIGAGTGTVTEVTVGTGLDVATGTTTPNITLNLSEFTDMTAAVDGAVDEMILLDNGAERRKLLSEISLSAFSNDSNWNNYTHPSYNGDDINVDTTLLSGATVVSDIDINITTDGTGHVTDANGVVSTRDLTLGDLGYTGATNANYYTHPGYNSDDFSVDTGALSGATVVSDIDINVTTDGTGHVTDANGAVSTRTLTLGDLGYTGETNATADQTDSEIETAYNNQVSIVTQVEAEAGTATTVRRWTAQRVAQAIAALAGSSGGGLQSTTVKTANYTAVAGDLVRVNPSSSFTITLPLGPSDGDRVGFVDVARNCATNNITIGRNSQNIGGLAQNMTVSTDGANFTLEYVSSFGWCFIS